MNTASHNNYSRLSTLIGAFLLSFTVFFGIQGCSSSNDAPVVIAPQDAVPVGYFTGTALLDAGPTDVQDMVGLAYGNRLMVFSAAENVLFDITMDITLSDFTGTVDVYVSGQITGSGVTVTGTVSNSRIEGDFAGGAGLAVGSFDILFDTNNNIGATLDRSESASTQFRTGLLKGIDADGSGVASVDSAGGYSIGDAVGELCDTSSGASLVIPDANINIYQLAHNVISVSAGTCSAPYLSTGHTGFASVIAKSIDKDTFVFAYVNGTVALFSEGLTRL